MLCAYIDKVYTYINMQFKIVTKCLIVSKFDVKLGSGVRFSKLQQVCDFLFLVPKVSLFIYFYFFFEVPNFDV